MTHETAQDQYTRAVAEFLEDLTSWRSRLARMVGTAQALLDKPPTDAQLVVEALGCPSLEGDIAAVDPGSSASGMYSVAASATVRWGQDLIDWIDAVKWDLARKIEATADNQKYLRDSIDEYHDLVARFNG